MKTKVTFFSLVVLLFYVRCSLGMAGLGWGNLFFGECYGEEKVNVTRLERVR